MIALVLIVVPWTTNTSSSAESPWRAAMSSMPRMIESA